MTSNGTLEQKIIALILDECGCVLDAEARACVTQEPDLVEKVSRIITEIQNQAVCAPDRQPADEDIIADDVVVSSAEIPPGLEGVESTESTESTESASEISPVSDSEAQETEPQPESWQAMPFNELAQSAALTDAQPVVNELKPGQVPDESVRMAKEPQPLLPPLANIIIANARAGDPFSSSVAISLDDGQPATLVDVVFPTDIGLRYEKESQTLTGVPTVSGDVNITVSWSCPSHHECKTTVLFVVNPDPKSLWKCVEPPADAPYPKAHVDHQGIVRDGVQIVAASRRGRSHEHAGSFRDDDFYINHSEATGWCVMLVADGAGSAVNSREGSRIAVQTAGDYLYGQFSGQKGTELKELIMNWEPDAQQATKNAMLHHFKQAATLAINNIQNEAICSDRPIKSYSTTLLATVSLRVEEELFAASFWLGDGAIAAYSPSGKVRVLGNPDSGEYAGQTRFLDKEIIADPAFTGRISIGKWRDVSHLILMTDGVSDPRFETDNGLRNDAKWTSLVNELSPLIVEADHAPARLAEWLNFFSPGNHDDRTLIVSW